MSRYKVYVVGHIWWPNGFHSNEYEFDAESDEDAIDRVIGMPGDRAHVVTGDFSIVTDFELYRCESCPTCGCLTMWHCVKEFEEESAATYADCIA